MATQGRRRTDILRLVAPEQDSAEGHRALNRLMAAEEPGFPAFDGAAELLRALPPCRWAVVTSNHAEPTAARLARTGLMVPEVCVGAEDVSEAKPSPEGYLTAAARLGTDPARCLVVEPAPAGIEAGRAAGCTVYAVTSTAEELRAEHACFASLAQAAGGRVAGDGRTRCGEVESRDRRRRRDESRPRCGSVIRTYMPEPDDERSHDPSPLPERPPETGTPPRGSSAC